jgi:hypothetical protein
LLPDRLKGIFRGSGAQEGSSSLFKGKGVEKEIVSLRQSRGLDQFFADIRDQSGLSILDMGGACQDNVNFITNLGHRITPQSILQSLDETFGGVADTDQSNPAQIESFLHENLDYPPECRVGATVSDRPSEKPSSGVLQFRRAGSAVSGVFFPHSRQDDVEAGAKRVSGDGAVIQ